MSKHRDVEAAYILNEGSVQTRPKIFLETGKRDENAWSGGGEMNATENRTEEHSLPLLDQPSSTPFIKKEINHNVPPLAESETDDLDTPGVNGHPALGNDQRHLDEGKKPASDEVDALGRYAISTDALSQDTTQARDDQDGNRHDKDEVDYFGDINGPHYGIESRMGDRPMSAMEIEQRIIPDVNVYQQKKNLAQGMMDLALLSANANQLRYVIESKSTHPYYWPSLVLIFLSIVFQVLVGIGLIMNSAYNVKNEDDICKADKINNLTILGIFLVTIVNVFITAFAVAEQGGSASNI